jgi:hypothetical protein
VINDGRSGVISPVDAAGNPLPHEEARSRVATFALGPCPAMQVLNVEAGPLQTSNNIETTQTGRIAIDHTEPRPATYYSR